MQGNRRPDPSLRLAIETHRDGLRRLSRMAARADRPSAECPGSEEDRVPFVDPEFAADEPMGGTDLEGNSARRHARGLSHGNGKRRGMTPSPQVHLRDHRMHLWNVVIEAVLALSPRDRAAIGRHFFAKTPIPGEEDVSRQSHAELRRALEALRRRLDRLFRCDRDAWMRILRPLV